MKVDKVKNTKRGIVYGLVNKMVTLILPFFVQTIMIKTLGVEYAGIKGVFTSILSVLSLTELGIGSAIVYNMYKPIAEDDIETIGVLLQLYKKLYRIIGFAVLALGLLITPFLSCFIKDGYPESIDLRDIFILYLGNTVISYWMYAYKAALLNAYQRVDIISNIGTITQALMSCFQILFLIVTRNFYVFLWISIAFTIVNNIITSVCVDKMYPEIRCEGRITKTLKKSIKKNVAGLVISKVCGTTRNTFDSIFMSMFLGLTQAAIYSNYFYILSALNGFTNIILSSLLAGIGNSVVIETKNYNYRKMMILNTAYMTISGWMAICMLCLYQPFMELWVGRELLFPGYVMVLFPLYFYMGKLGDIRGVYADAAGLFWENRYRTLLEALANLILNYLFVKKWGAFGIMLATIITLFFIGFLGSTIVIFKHYFKVGMKKYLMNQISYLFATCIAGIITYFICSWMEMDSIIGTLILRIVICLTIAPFLLYMLVGWRKDFKESCSWLYGVLRK